MITIVSKLNLFIVLNPFLAMFIFLIIGMYMDRLYLRLNPNYKLLKGKKR
jgi:hypothetical protein